ncbi:TPA: hypothetical protein DCX16_01620 [bacterium]|nr:hypothetical protein [bacterium]
MNGKIENLIQKANESLNSAILLVNEGYNDPSVSRAYYAMFYAAEAILLTKGLKFSSHRGVISQFGEHFVKTGIFPKELGEKLSKAYERRLNGDYEFAFIFSEEEAKEIIEWAKNFVGNVKDYLAKERYI